MKIPLNEIRALEAAVGQFLDMIEAGSMDDRRLCRKVMLKYKRTNFQIQLGC